MARRRGRYLRRRLTRNQKFAGSAVIAGLLLAAVHGHTPGPAATASAPAAIAGCGGSNEALANCMAAAALRLDRLADDLPGRAVDPGKQLRDRRHQPHLRRLRHPADRCPPPRWPPPGRTGRPARPRRSGWGLSYIAATYGTPCAAWSHEEAVSVVLNPGQPPGAARPILPATRKGPPQW